MILKWHKIYGKWTGNNIRDECKTESDETINGGIVAWDIVIKQPGCRLWKVTVLEDGVDDTTGSGHERKDN